METMINASELEKITNQCGFLSGTCISSWGNSGGMGFWWKNIEVRLNLAIPTMYWLQPLMVMESPYRLLLASMGGLRLKTNIEPGT